MKSKFLDVVFGAGNVGFRDDQVFKSRDLENEPRKSSHSDKLSQDHHRNNSRAGKRSQIEGGTADLGKYVFLNDFVGKC